MARNVSGQTIPTTTSPEYDKSNFPRLSDREKLNIKLMMFNLKKIYQVKKRMYFIEKNIHLLKTLVRFSGWSPRAAPGYIAGRRGARAPDGASTPLGNDTNWCSHVGLHTRDGHDLRMTTLRGLLT